MKFSNLVNTSTLIVALTFSIPILADNYVIDNAGAHSTIQFKISHLGYSWLWGRFNRLEGDFNYDPKKMTSSNVNVSVDAASVDTNHAELDKHLRSNDFLDVKKYPRIEFISTKYTPLSNGKGKLKGKLTFHGVTKEIEIDTRRVGAGDDPWGEYRFGIEGQTRIKLADYNIKKDLGPAAAELELFITLEGIRQ